MVQIHKHALENSKKIFVEKILNKSIKNGFDSTADLAGSRSAADLELAAETTLNQERVLENKKKIHEYIQWMNTQDTVLYTIQACDESIACFALLSRPNFLTNPYYMKLGFDNSLKYDNIDFEKYSFNHNFDRTKFTKYYQLKYIETFSEYKQQYYAMNMMIHFQSHENVIIKNDDTIMKHIYEKCKYKNIEPDIYISNYNSGKYKND